MSMDWNARTHWIFDMDGTLTVPAHDFAAFKRANGLSEDEDLLSAAGRMATAERAAFMQRIREWELRIAASSTAQEDAVALLSALTGRGATCGVLTRNTRDNALLTLEAADLMRFFPDEQAILGRNCATAKPHPAGVNKLLDHWDVRPERAVMVGDWVHDVAAGHAAGTATILVLRHGTPDPSWLPYCSTTELSLTSFV